MAYGTARMLHQVSKGVIFFWRKTYLLAALLHTATSVVKRKVADGHDNVRPRGRSMGAADGRSQPCSEFSDLKRLRDVVGGSCVESLDNVLFLVPYGQHNDGKMRIGFGDSAACLFAAHSRHVDVQQHGIVIYHAQAQEGRLSVGSLSDCKSQSSQSLEQALADAGVVLHDEHFALLLHVYSSLAARGRAIANVVPVARSLSTQTRPR